MSMKATPRCDMKMPEWDYAKLRPKTKMPDCPTCEEDELGMINESYVLCYNCGFTAWSSKTDRNIREVI